MFPTAGDPIGSTFVIRPSGARSLLVPLSIAAPSWVAEAPVGCSWATAASNLQRDPPALPEALEEAGAAVPVPLGTCLSPLAAGSVTAETAALLLGALCLTTGAPLELEGMPPSFWGAFPLAAAECCRCCLSFGGDGGGFGPPPMAPPASRSFPVISRRPPAGFCSDDAVPPSTWAGTCRGTPPGGCGRALALGPPPSALMGVGTCLGTAGPGGLDSVGYSRLSFCPRGVSAGSRRVT